MAWTNPGNIDSAVSFASVSLGAGGTNYTPSTQNGSASVTANSGNPNPSPVLSAAMGGFASVAASACTLYVTINWSVTGSSGGGTVNINLSTNSGVSWSQPFSSGVTVGSTVIPITVAGITNLNTIRIQVEATAACAPTGFATATGNITAWHATIPGGSGTSSQTLAAGISGLSVPSNATIVGIKISFNADYSGTAPTFTLRLNVGSLAPTFTLTAGPAPYMAGGPTELWGYGSWSNTTLASLLAEFYASTAGTTTVNVNTLVVTVYYTLNAMQSAVLSVSSFGFAVPSSSSITGIQVNVKGFSPAATLYAQLLQGGVAVGNVLSTALPTSNNFVPLGGGTDTWGSTWNYSQIDASGFGVNLWATSPSGATVSLDYADIVIFGTSSQANFNGLMSANLNEVDQTTLTLDASGVTWQEDVTNTPNQLALQSLIPTVTPGSYLKGVDADGTAYMCYPNAHLTTGANQPMQFNGRWCDRITQVGPGAPPTFTASQQAGTQASVTAYSFSGGILTLTAANTFTAGELVSFSGFTGACVSLNGLTFSVLGTGLSGTQFEIATSLVAGSGSDAGVATPQFSYPIAPSATGITQPAAYSDPGNAGHLSVMLWSNGPGSKTSGNVITVYYQSELRFPESDPVLTAAFNAGYPVYVYISGAPFGNGTWQVTSIGKALPPGVSHWRYYFTIQVPSSAYQNVVEPVGQYQVTQATVTLLTAAPGLAPGDRQVSLSGVTNSAWDQTFNIVEALNSGSFSISQTSLTSGVATYSWTLVSGTAPAAGQLVTITGTLNANGALNETNAQIASASGVSSGTFTVAGFSSTIDYPTAVETGQATTAGTQFVVDPGAALVGNTSQSPILGNSGGGLLNVVGAAMGGTFPIGPGTRQGVVGFITRNGAVTRPSPPTTFTVTIGSNYITASNIPLGPPNVVARYIAFTEAGQNGVPGANFYTYDTPDIFTVGGVVFTASALIVPDNVTTTMKFTFSDAVLLSSDEIDVEGNNYFNLIELGNPAWMFQYANPDALRALPQNKVQNFNNLTFDGGYLPTGTTALPQPLGWTALNLAPQTYAITAFQITSNVVTFTATNSLTLGTQVTVDGLATGTYLNGITYTVTAASGSNFSAAFTHGNVTLTPDTGTAVVASSYTGLVTSPAFGNSFVITNYNSTAITNTWVIFQNAAVDAYNVGIIQPNTAYSVRVTARALTCKRAFQHSDPDWPPLQVEHSEPASGLQPSRSQPAISLFRPRRSPIAPASL